MDAEAVWNAAPHPLVWNQGLVEVQSGLKPEAWEATHREVCERCRRFDGAKWATSTGRVLHIDPSCYGAAMCSCIVAGCPIGADAVSGKPIAVVLEDGPPPPTAVVFVAPAARHPVRRLRTIPTPLRARNAPSVAEHGEVLLDKFQAEVNGGKVERIRGRPRVQAPLLAVVRPSDREDATRTGRAPKARLCVGLHRGVNTALPKWPLSFMTVAAWLSTVRPSWWLACDDFSSFYRQFPLSREASDLVGFYWPYEAGDGHGPGFFRDTRLPFGLSTAPAMACGFSAHFAQVLAARVRRRFGTHTPWSLLVYIDDVCIAAKSMDLCAAIRRMAYALAAELGLGFNSAKAAPIRQRQVVLGLLVDTDKRMVSISEDRRTRLVRFIQHLLEEDAVSKQQIRRAAGRLTWVSAVIPASRVRVRSLWALLSDRFRSASTLPMEVRSDLKWWLPKLRDLAAGERLWPDFRRMAVLAVDSSGLDDGGSGAVLLIDGSVRVAKWRWPKRLLAQFRRGDSSMLRELAGVQWSVQRWRHRVAGRPLLIVCDNSSTVFALNAGWSRGPFRRRLLGSVVDVLVASKTPYAAVWASRDTAIVRLCDSLTRATPPAPHSPLQAPAPAGRPRGRLGQSAVDGGSTQLDRSHLRPLLH